MLFSSNVFLFLFLPFVVLIYFLIRKPLQNLFLLLASLLFYAWGEPKVVFVMILSILTNYGFGILLEKMRASKYIFKIVFCSAVSFNLLVLGVFKYLNFIIANLNKLGLSIMPANIVLPIGISFFTFQALSYIIDVYRNTVTAQYRLQDVGLYISFFPQLVAGPIVRYQDIEEQIASRKTSLEDIGEGARRFIIGLSKKVIVANNMAVVADFAFQNTSEVSSFLCWMGALAYTLQIYYDFSGYSDMAIGLGRIFGFHFLENFNYPYISKTVGEFWRRWHISLGGWFRDYVYFPLGGSRVNSKPKLIRNLFIVWLLTGIWHGAGWNFIFWGMLHFSFIAIEKLFDIPNRCSSTFSKVLYQTITMLVVVFGWVLFRAPGTYAAGSYILKMLGFSSSPFFNDITYYYVKEYLAYFIFAILFSTPVISKLKNRCFSNKKPRAISIMQFAEIPVYLFLFILSISFLLMGAHNPFIYFNF